LDHFAVVGFQGQEESLAVDAGFIDAVGVLGEVSEFVEDDVFRVPLAIAVGAPLGEVLFRDGFAVEKLGDDFDDFRLGVEPVDEFFAFVAVVEAPV
jgi:hypothetical protein